jgi:CBS domain-containing protein
MTSDPITLTPDADATTALSMMIERGFRHIPILEAESVVGIVSMRDVTPR